MHTTANDADDQGDSSCPPGSNDEPRRREHHQHAEPVAARLGSVENLDARHRDDYGRQFRGAGVERSQRCISEQRGNRTGHDGRRSQQDFGDAPTQRHQKQRMGRVAVSRERTGHQICRRAETLNGPEAPEFVDP